MKRAEMWERLESRGDKMVGFSIEHRYMLPSHSGVPGQQSITREQLQWALSEIHKWKVGDMTHTPEPLAPRGRNRHRSTIQGVLPR